MHRLEMRPEANYQFDKKRIALKSRKEGKKADYQFDNLKIMYIYSDILHKYIKIRVIWKNMQKLCKKVVDIF